MNGMGGQVAAEYTECESPQTSLYASADIISIIGQGVQVWMDPNKAVKPAGGRNPFQHKIGSDIGPGMAAISDFMLIRGSERNLLALSYNVLGLCSYSFGPKTFIINPMQVEQTLY